MSIKRHIAFRSWAGRAAVGVLTVGLLSTGCATQRAMNNNARAGADQVAALQRAVQQKVNTENAYYAGELKAIAESIARARQISIEQQLERGARTFASENSGGTTADQLAAFLQSQVTAWQTAEEAHQQLRTQVTSQLASGRQQLDANAAQLSELRNKLQVLGEARSKKALAAFIHAFVTQTVTDVQQQKQQAPGQAAAPATPTESDPSS